MFEKTVLNENNERILTQIGGKNADMCMDIKVKLLKAGESLDFISGSNEAAFLLLRGEVTFLFNGEEKNGKRKNPFEKTPYCLHVSKNTEVTVKAVTECEILIQQAENDIIFSPVFYTPETCLYQEFGKGQWGGAGHRICSTMFDYDNAPYSNMVLGEVFNQPGKWSSYPPHHHPQPEVYYYQFDKPQGFGACFLGDDVYKSTDKSYCCITDDNDHEQVVAPGYEMCYVWMIHHNENDPWYKTTRLYTKEHEWLVNEK